MLEKPKIKRKRGFIIMTVTINKELYKEIPKSVVHFVQTQNTTYLDKKDGEIILDIQKDGELLDATLYFNQQDDYITARIEAVTDLKTLQYDYLLNNNVISDKQGMKLAKEFEVLFQQIEKTVKDAGYSFGMSHEVGDGLYAYWDVVMTEGTFDGEVFLYIWEQFIDFFNKLTTTLKQLGFEF
jgi:hypothetical protein